MNKLEHGLGADLEDDPGPVPLGGVVNDHGEAQMEIVSCEAPGEVRQGPGGYLGVHSGAPDKEGGQEVNGGWLTKAEVSLRSPVDPEDIVPCVGGTDLKRGCGPVLLLQVAEAVVIKLLTLGLGAGVEPVPVPHHLPSAQSEHSAVLQLPGRPHLSLQLQTIVEEVR